MPATLVGMEFKTTIDDDGNWTLSNSRYQLRLRFSKAELEYAELFGGPRVEDALELIHRLFGEGRDVVRWEEVTAPGWRES